MTVTCDITDLADFPARYGAIERKETIVNAGKGKAFMAVLETLYPEGITQSHLNDLLYHEGTWCYELVDLNEYGVEILTSDDIIGTCTIREAIDEAIDDFIWKQKADYGIEYTTDEIMVLDSRFEADIEEWLKENQGEESDPDILAERWLADKGYDLIERAIYEVQS